MLGIEYAGALQVLEEQGVMTGIERVAGASAGAFTAALVAQKYTSAEIKEVVGSMYFASFEDGNVFNDIEVLNKYGIHPGHTLLACAEGLFSKKLGTNATFADLRAKGFLDLHVVVTNMDTGNPEVLSFDTAPNVVISEAVRASMSIPWFFYAFALSTDPNQTLYQDGGTEWNFPLTIFDDVCGNLETLGLFLTPDGDAPAPAHLKHGHFGSAIKRDFQAVLNAQDVAFFRNPDQVRRTIQLFHPARLTATDFNLTDADKDTLFNAGVQCTQQWYQNLFNSKKAA